MVVVALTNSSVFDKKEEKAYFILMRLTSKGEFTNLDLKKELSLRLKEKNRQSYCSLSMI